MINNIIRINRAELDRLSQLTEQKGYIAATFNIATQDKFPLHKIHYVFDNINRGWYADGSTKCPIEEHYALPKDGYCHLWEKRNVTDDDYPERWEK